jgi:hypothetical protein
MARLMPIIPNCSVSCIIIPDVSEGHRYKDFGSFKLCGEGQYPKTFLLRGQPADGEEVQ